MTDNTKTRVSIARCPDCGEKIRMEGAIQIGRQVFCPECDSELEVVDTQPVTLDWAYEDEEEEEEEDDEDW